MICSLGTALPEIWQIRHDRLIKLNSISFLVMFSIKLSWQYYLSPGIELVEYNDGSVESVS